MMLDNPVVFVSTTTIVIIGVGVLLTFFERSRAVGLLAVVIAAVLAVFWAMFSSFLIALGGRMASL